MPEVCVFYLYASLQSPGLHLYLWVRSKLFHNPTPPPKILSSFGIRRVVDLGHAPEWACSVGSIFSAPPLNTAAHWWTCGCLTQHLEMVVGHAMAPGTCSYFLTSKLIVLGFQGSSLRSTHFMRGSMEEFSQVALLSDLGAILLLGSQQSYYCALHFCSNWLLPRFVFRPAEWTCFWLLPPRLISCTFLNGI